ncbi:serine-rich adhesin for platelets-like [Haliotis cracherodii]|uniref:serine-rich adhesin for platelets-like n=1 Tax=Haliotis cracherodii TaxID=6455 RepID=UPI0039E7D675
MNLSRPIFPFDLPNWQEVKVLLNELKENCLSEAFDAEDIVRHVQLVYVTNHDTVLYDGGLQNSSNSLVNKTRSKRDKRSKIDQSCIWFGVWKFIKKATEEENDKFLFTVIPGICDLVIESEKLIPSDFTFSEQQKCGSSILSKRCVAAILACSFLCLFPERERSRWTKLNVINFTNFFKQLPMSSQNAKMRCILNYFERVTEPGIALTGNVTYARQVIDTEMLLTTEDVTSSDAELCSMFIHTDGFIEDLGSEAIEVDFANRSIGGGVLGRGRVQEEIRFCTCPELIASMLFMENMEDNEAILISGFEQFSQHSGYASGLEYVGDYRDDTEIDEWGNVKRTLCAIDATPFKHDKFRQYTESCVMRELNKAVVGFCDVGGADLDTSSRLSMSSHGLNTSTDEEYHTAVQSPTEEDGGKRRLSNFVVTLLSQAMHQAVKESVDKHKSGEETKESDQSKSSSGSISQSDLSIPEVNQSDASNDPGSSCDRNHNQVSRTIPPQPPNGSSDLLDVDYADWLSNFRRRSSNLSDVSRRSSSSTKHSSDLSSDLEEIYESYLKNEKNRHSTIEEETGQAGIADFATKLVACLMQEGTSTAAQMMPGMQMFSHLAPPDNAVKPCALRPDPSIDIEVDDVPASVSDCEEDTEEPPPLLQHYAQSLLDATLPAAFQDVVQLALSPLPSPLPSHQDLPTDRMYEWYADQIVQQVFLHVSQELAGEELPNSPAHDDPPTAATSTQSAEPPSSSSSHNNSSASFSSSCSLSVSGRRTSEDSSSDRRPSEGCAFDRKPSEDSFSDRRLSEGFTSDRRLSEGCTTDKRHSEDLHEENPSDDCVSDRRSSAGCTLPSDGRISGSVIEVQNIQSLSCDTRSSTPKPDQGEETGCSIPSKLDKIIPNDFEIKVDYHAAAAIIVDHVFQTLPTHLESLAATSPGNHSINGRNTSIRSLGTRGSFKGLTDTLSSVSDGKDPVKVVKPEESEKMSRAGLPNVGVLTKKLSREMLTKAFLNVEDRRHIKSYERRSSEPCHISVELSLQAYNSNKLVSMDEDKRRKISRTDDDLERVRGESSRRGSWSSFPTSRRRSSCGFKDPILSKFAEELMKADTTVPPLLLMGAQTSTSTTGSRRSSLSGFRDTTLANLENELLNSSFCQPSSPRHSIRSKGSRKGRDKLTHSESSETEYWFPLPKKVGTECQEELYRSGYYHSVDEIEDFADMFANDILNQAVNIIYRDARIDMEREELAGSQRVHSYADELATAVIRSALESLQGMSFDEVSSVISNSSKVVGDSSADQPDFTDALDVPFAHVEEFADTLSGQLLKEAMDVLQKHSKCKSRLKSRGLPISSGNWGCGAFGGDPQLKSLLQWMAASLVKAPGLHYYTFNDGRLIQFDEIVAVIQSLGWTVGRLMSEVKGYCNMISEEMEKRGDIDGYPSITLFEYIVSNIYM